MPEGDSEASEIASLEAEFNAIHDWLEKQELPKAEK
jgi:hypothetical protein